MNITNIEKFYIECLSGCTIVYLPDRTKLFFGKEVANSIGFRAARQAIINHVEEGHRSTLGYFEEYISNIRIIAPIGSKKHSTIMLTEAGVYDLALRSKNEKVKEFIRWVTERALPTLNVHRVKI